MEREKQFESFHPMDPNMMDSPISISCGSRLPEAAPVHMESCKVLTTGHFFPNRWPDGRLSCSIVSGT